MLGRWPTGKDPVLLLAVCLGRGGRGGEEADSLMLLAGLWPMEKPAVLLLAVWIGRFSRLLLVLDWLGSFFALAFPSEVFARLAGGGCCGFSAITCPFDVTSPCDPKLMFMLMLLAASGCLRFFPAVLPGVAVVPAWALYAAFAFRSAAAYSFFISVSSFEISLGTTSLEPLRASSNRILALALSLEGGSP